MLKEYLLAKAAIKKTQNTVALEYTSLQYVEKCLFITTTTYC